MDDEDTHWADDLDRLSPDYLRAWDEAGRPATLREGEALMEELELREAFVAHYRQLQSGEDSPYPVGGAVIRGLANAQPGDIGYGERQDSWNYLERLIEAEVAEIAAIKKRMREAADYLEEREDT